MATIPRPAPGFRRNQLSSETSAGVRQFDTVLTADEAVITENRFLTGPQAVVSTTTTDTKEVKAAPGDSLRKLKEEARGVNDTFRFDPANSTRTAPSMNTTGPVASRATSQSTPSQETTTTKEFTSELDVTAPVPALQDALGINVTPHDLAAGVAAGAGTVIGGLPGQAVGAIGSAVADIDQNAGLNEVRSAFGLAPVDLSIGRTLARAVVPFGRRAIDGPEEMQREQTAKDILGGNTRAMDMVDEVTTSSDLDTNLGGLPSGTVTGSNFGRSEPTVTGRIGAKGSLSSRSARNVSKSRQGLQETTSLSSKAPIGQASVTTAADVARDLSRDRGSGSVNDAGRVNPDSGRGSGGGRGSGLPGSGSPSVTGVSPGHSGMSQAEASQSSHDPSRGSVAGVDRLGATRGGLESSKDRGGRGSDLGKGNSPTGSDKGHGTPF